MASEKDDPHAGMSEHGNEASPFPESPFAEPPVEPTASRRSQDVHPPDEKDAERERPAFEKGADAAASDEASMRSGKSFTVPMLGRVSLGSDASSRVQTLAVFSGSLYFMLPMAFVSFVVTVLLLFNPLTVLFAVAYLVWMRYFDDSSVTGSRTPWLRSKKWWKFYCDFFPITLIKTANLDPDAKYVFGYHPHGIISVGAFGAFGTDGAHTLDLTAPEDNTKDAGKGRGFTALFPGIDRRLITLPVNFLVPFVREYYLSFGLCDSSAKTFQNVLGRGTGSSVVVVVGGAEESTMSTPGAIDLVLEKRKGFVREAIMAGAALVPVIAFGENDLYATFNLPPEHWFSQLQGAVKKNLGFAIPLFKGRSMTFMEFGLMPLRKPVNIVVGSPILPPKMSEEERHSFNPEMDKKTYAPQNKDAELLLEHHTKYVEALESLYQEYKNCPWNTPGLMRTGTLKLRK